MIDIIGKVLKAVNYHITKRCNYGCRYCFAHFRGVGGELPLSEALRIPGQLAELGCEKLNFCGGEPLLYPGLREVLIESYDCGLVTGMVTNGSLLTREMIDDLAEYLDWVGVSLDSKNEKVQQELGRGNGNQVELTVEIMDVLHEYGVKTKINTVVTALNRKEDMRPLIKMIDPHRWKVFQVLEIKGENDKAVKSLLISREQYETYKKRNSLTLRNGKEPVFEDNVLITGSYIMLDPMGRFFHNVNGRLEYLEMKSLAEGISEVPFYEERFRARGGVYDY